MRPTVGCKQANAGRLLLATSAVPGESVAVFLGQTRAGYRSPSPVRVENRLKRWLPMTSTLPGQSLPADVSKEGPDWASCFELK